MKRLSAIFAILLAIGTSLSAQDNPSKYGISCVIEGDSMTVAIWCYWDSNHDGPCYAILSQSCNILVIDDIDSIPYERHGDTVVLLERIDTVRFVYRLPLGRFVSDDGIIDLRREDNWYPHRNDKVCFIYMSIYEYDKIAILNDYLLGVDVARKEGDFNIDKECDGIHLTLLPNHNVLSANITPWDDPIMNAATFNIVKLKAAEFDSAAQLSGNWEYINSKRDPNAADTAIFLEWGRDLDVTIEDMSECGFSNFGQIPYIELAGGDFCCTRLHHDSTYMVPCGMKMSKDGFIGGTIRDDYDYEQGYVYIYPYDSASKRVGRPYVYPTGPYWRPSMRAEFWGKDGWFYVEGILTNRNAGIEGNDYFYVYYKVRPKALRDN